MSGNLYLVSTPIGNPDDMTLRAVRVLTESDAVICEERREGSTLLAHLRLVKPLVELNEHTEEQVSETLVERLAAGENLALISDHGTPIVADPGARLVSRALQAGIHVVPVPGASAVIAAMVTSGLPEKRFRFLGQLPPKTETRRRALRALKHEPQTFILLEAPYRLIPLLRSVRDEFGGGRQICVACNLTMPDERIVRGTVGNVIEVFGRQPFRGEFVLVVAGDTTDKQQK